MFSVLIQFCLNWRIKCFERFVSSYLHCSKSLKLTENGLRTSDTCKIIGSWLFDVSHRRVLTEFVTNTCSLSSDITELSLKKITLTAKCALIDKECLEGVLKIGNLLCTVVMSTEVLN